MPLPFNRRAFLPACLTLGTLLYALPPPPVFADSPAAPAADAAQAKTLLLQNAVPGEILKAMHWDRAANLPEGVTRISAQPATNSLSVVATPAGLAKVKQMVKLLDIVQRQVQIKMALANATAADLKAAGIRFDVIPDPGPPHPSGAEIGYAAGIAAVGQFLQTLIKQGAVLQSPTVITTNNVDAALSISGGQPIPTLPDVESFTFAATPRVNSDDTVTLVLHPHATWRVAGKSNADGTPVIATESLDTTRTLRSGDTLVFTNLFAGAAGGGDRQILLFVTPTTLPTNKGPAAMTVK